MPRGMDQLECCSSLSHCRLAYDWLPLCLYSTSFNALPFEVIEGEVARNAFFYDDRSELQAETSWFKNEVVGILNQEISGCKRHKQHQM